MLFLLFWQTFPRASECSYALLQLKHPPVTCFAAHTPSLSHVSSLFPAVAAMRTADLSAAPSTPPWRGCGAGRSPLPPPPARTQARPALRRLFDKRSGLLSAGGGLSQRLCWPARGWGHRLAPPASLQCQRPWPLRSRPAGSGPPHDPLRAEVACFFSFSFFHFFPLFLLRDIFLRAFFSSRANLRAGFGEDRSCRPQCGEGGAG